MKTKTLIWISIILSFVGTCFVYSALPESIPTHWNMKGVPDDFSSKQSIFVMAVIPAFLYWMLIFLPKIDPKKDNHIKHDKAYIKITASIIFVMIALHWLTVLASLEIIENVSLFFRIIVGVLFIMIGNYMTQLRMNYFAGIKLPWTLANETVWKKTHRVGGIGFVLIGLVSIVTSLFQTHLSFYWFIVSAIVVILFTVIYSYIEYTRIKK
ncbi:hypothetical protein CVD28_03050 [Bacillus sp. M6-12]|uniref:SdpI family protein n=1 Tax=Bacillus sp. M6-12 TaxID=2054166 RepID=UPI000C767899|nr:SdpI family protein [Bacillus sp. M6-12]PLS19407.1 hypothetical protein CVD28_03050 [Bacillus sp. M6-12]